VCSNVINVCDGVFSFSHLRTARFIQGFSACKSYIEKYQGPRKAVRRGGLFVDADVHASLSKHAAEQGLTVGKLASKVLGEYLEKAQS